MQDRAFRTWLERRSTAARTVATYMGDAARVERYHGDLDEHYSSDRLAGLLRALTYSADDARRCAPSPSAIPINPRSLSPYKSAVVRYREFRDGAPPPHESSLPARPRP